ncbi:bifunctional nuclease family protein [Actinomycetospora endophytica]|uniref:Bifunctional nuclease family protein n=1 Tax=Actinomycetospora endophytica TaxID=2291215 RepID=A0ABS8P6I9_9PSEU|nr:bifunctional nuclease family protein [Actinomycetospora endophytica]MCD2193648.1 bifunctional nuclease family protein [Actinomycetospora endophytica]
MGEGGAEDREATLLGIGIDPASGAPLMVLRERGGARRAVPIWIGPAEAQQIALVVGRERPRRPLTHQLLIDVVAALGQRLTHVRICGLAEGTFLAEVALAGGARVSARPSDAVPVALAAAIPIYLATAVLDVAAMPLERIADGEFADPAPSPELAGAAEIDAHAAALRRWLDTTSPADFDRPPGNDDPH